VAVGQQDLARLAEIYDHYHGTDAAKPNCATRTWKRRRDFLGNQRTRPLRAS
jgi:hypothetical protein